MDVTNVVSLLVRAKLSRKVIFAAEKLSYDSELSAALLCSFFLRIFQICA